MMEIFIAILAIGLLIILHELGHLLAAKHYGVKVEEFGIGIPPRIAGIRRGETLYSLNVLPLGGFVRMLGEDQNVDNPRSFSAKPVFQRLVIILAGVAMFWVASAVIFAGVGATVGIPAGISDGDDASGMGRLAISIAGVSDGSPAYEAGLRAGDAIVGLRAQGESIIPESIEEVQAFISRHAGNKVVLQAVFGSEERQVQLVPRADPPPGEGAMGIQLIMTGLLKFSPLSAPFRGIALTWNVTKDVVRGLWTFFSGLAAGEGIPAGAGMAGPVGIVRLMGGAWGMGMGAFLVFLAQISVHLAILNLLPIPALDGGRALMIGIEGVIGRPLPERPTRHAVALSFILLIGLMIWITLAFDL